MIILHEIGKFLVLLLILLGLGGCYNKKPMALRSKVGMSRKDVIALIGKPSYSGGYVASVLPGQPYSPQYTRYILFFVYPDNSLVVFRKDTVVDIKQDSDPFFQKLKQFSRKHKMQKTPILKN